MSENTDGRHARRARNRAAVIDAVYELVKSGKVPPTVDDVAQQAGVSVSSIFRIFDGLPDLQRQALHEFQRRYRRQLAVDDADAPRPDRIRAHVRTRVQLYAEIAGLLRIARSRAVDHQPMLEGLSEFRANMASQTRQRFSLEVSQLTPAAAANLVALIDATTSPDAYDVMTAAHARSDRHITRLWTDTLDAVLASVTPDRADAQPDDQPEPKESEYR